MCAVFFSLVGRWNTFRILQYWKKNCLIPSSGYLLGFFILSIFLNAMVFLFSKNILGVIVFLVAEVAIFFIVGIFLEGRRREFFDRQLLFMLDHVLAGMRSGRAFREALADVTPSCIGFPLLLEMLEAVAFRRPFLVPRDFDRAGRVYHELCSLQASSYKTIERLQSFRKALRLEEQFRRKSRAAMAQTRMQASVALLLYIGMTFFSFYEFDFYQVLKPLIISGLLFLAGLIWILNLGRGFRWKV